MTSVQEVLFSSFLSGALLQKNSLSYSKLATSLTVFSTTNDIVVYEPDNDCDKLTDFVDFEENRIVLKQTVNGKSFHNGKFVDARSYLESLTTEEIRDYFGIKNYDKTPTKPFVRMLRK